MHHTELIETYTRFIKTTYPGGHTREQVICNCVLGVVGEYWEWVDAHPPSRDELHEAGDVLYYVMMLSETLGLDTYTLVLESLSLVPESLSRLGGTDDCYAILTEATKKHLFYAPPKYTDSEYTSIVRSVLIRYLWAILSSHTLEDVILANTRKLSKRYDKPNPMEALQ